MLFVKCDGQPIPPEVVRGVVGYFILFIGLLGLGTMLLTLLIQLDQAAIPAVAGPNDELITAFTASLSALGNIGPGLAGVGSDCNYASLPETGKWLLSFLMLLGRLELLTVLVLIAPGAWRK